jgi:hypothetical protein
VSGIGFLSVEMKSFQGQRVGLIDRLMLVLAGVMYVVGLLCL